ncbi:MAG: hypothetical protein ACT4P1_10300 [Sporichthyaceae bacterium]
MTSPGGRPRLILHLGWDEATGRSLQHYLVGHFPLLREQGILYPATGRSAAVPSAHTLLAPMFDGSGPVDQGNCSWPRERGELVSAILGEVRLSGAKTVIISTHDLARLNQSDVPEFAAAFADFDVAPVVVIRNFPDALSQRYGSMVMSGTVSDEPGPGMLERGMVKRLAAWASIASDGKLRVIDADASPTGSVTADLLAAFGIGDCLPCPPPDPDPPADPVPPAVVALVRDFRAQGIAEINIQGLVQQLSHIAFVEHQTNVPEDLAAVLSERYAKFFERLRNSSFVQWIGSVNEPQPRAQRPIHVANVAAAVFAIGRALDLRRGDVAVQSGS